MRVAIAIGIALLGPILLTVAREKPAGDTPLVGLKGVWSVVSTSGHGKVVTAEGGKAHDGTPLWSETTFTITGDKLATVQEPVVLSEAKPEVGLYFAINTSARNYRLRIAKAKEKEPAAVDLIVDKDIVLKGIYERKGDVLKLCFVNWLALSGEDDKAKAKNAEGKARPTNFTTKPGGEYVSFVLKRTKP